MKTAKETIKQFSHYLAGVEVIYTDKAVECCEDYAASKEARIKELEEGLNTIIGYNLQEAHDRYGDKNKAEQWACVVAARKALGTK